MRLTITILFALGSVGILSFAARESFHREFPIPDEGKISKTKPTDDLGFEVPEGFEVSLYADDSLATDVFSLTIDSKGRIVVASKGYIKILHDTNGDGRADKATTFANFPKTGAHGMCFDGNDLICDGDNGVRRLYDTDGDGKCDKVSPAWIRTTKDGGHSANGIVRGPDGWFYLIGGNDTGIGREHAKSPGSPVKAVNGGAVVRISPDGKTSEVVAHGFRNPYDLGFNHFGHMFTVDADGERIYQMPYYAPNRLFDIAPGRHHGWILPGWRRGWSRPAEWADSVGRLVEIGRGSPTGVTVYRHRTFPKRYRNGVFSLCWTFGRVYFFPLKRKGSTYTGKTEIFMRTTGDIGFAPTDMAVDPKGDLYVAIGGRGTRGSVFRVHYTGKTDSPPLPRTPLRRVLAADQPLSSWSRARWLPLAKQLGKRSFLVAVANEQLPLIERIRAVEILTELYDGVSMPLAHKICKSKTDHELAARVLWSISKTNTSKAARELYVAQTRSSDPRVARAAWEALLSFTSALDPKGNSPDWRGGLNSKDRRVRSAALMTAKGPGRESFLGSLKTSPRKLSSRERLAMLWIQAPEVGDRTGAWKAERWKQKEKIREWFDTCLDVLEKEKDTAVQLEAVRLLQIALGDIHTDKDAIQEFYGYVARARDKVDPKLRERAARTVAARFPAGDESLDRELARLMGMFVEDVPGFLDRIAAKWRKNSHPKNDIHYLMVLSRLPGKRSRAVTKGTASALANLHTKLAQIATKPTDQVPSILEKLLRNLLKQDSALAGALVADSAFGLPGHELFAHQLPLREQQKAARKIVATIMKLDGRQARAAWNSEVVRLVATLPDREKLPILRQQFNDPRLQDSIVLVLAKKPKAEDRGRFVTALDSIQPSVLRTAATSLAMLSKKATPTEIGKAVRTFRRMTKYRKDTKTQNALEKLLVRWTNQESPAQKDANARADAWVTWFTKTYPKIAAELPGVSGVKLASWQKRLARVDWSAGNVDRGEAVFQRKSCFRCHGGSRRLGPDLRGVAQRFSREDLFTAIVDPNKDVSPAYRGTAILTKSGKVYSGMVIYKSPALTLLQTTPDTTVRIPQSELSVMQPARVSFMPAGLLDDVTDSDIAHLYAYLKSLRK